MNPADRWNPGWQQFMLNQQRAQAGGNRQVHPPGLNQFVPARHNNDRNGQPRRNNNNVQPQNQNRRNQNRQNNHNPVRREHRNQGREVMTRDDLERIEAVSRKNFQTRTALEYDKREDQCWLNIHNEIEEKSRHFTTSFGRNSGDVLIPSEDNICSNLRVENQNEIILMTRELLSNFGATEQELDGALTNLESHLKTNALEYNLIEGLSNELAQNAGKLTKETDELDDILRRIDAIRLHK